MNDIKSILETIYWDELTKEGITKDDLEMVDLDIAYEPVTAIKGGDPCSVMLLQDGKYIVESEFGKQIVTADVLKVMRYRYLEFDPERIRQREWVNNLFNK